MKKVYIDLDGVIADFEKGRKDHPLGKISPYIGRPDKLPGVYENLKYDPYFEDLDNETPSLYYK